jgi:hypothetical protein
MSEALPQFEFRMARTMESLVQNPNLVRFNFQGAKNVDFLWTVSIQYWKWGLFQVKYEVVAN